MNVLRSTSLIYLLLCAIAYAQDRPKIGLVLGGGGAAGVAHVGVIKVLEANNIPIDMIAGNSMGAIIGSLYASGMPIDELEEQVKKLDWESMFSDSPSRDLKSFKQKREDRSFHSLLELGLSKDGLQLSSGVIGGQKLMFTLRRLLAPVEYIHNFDSLPIPFRAVATDIHNGEEVVLRGGNLATAVRASMSLPGIFTPVKVHGRLLVDGLVSNNLPVNLARDMGADILIVSNIPLRPNKKLNSALDITLQAMDFLMSKTSEAQLASLTDKDILIEPPIGDIGSLDFERVKETIPLGIIGANKQIAKLKKLANYWNVNSPRRATRPPPSKIRLAKITLKNNSVLRDRLVIDSLGLKTGDIVTTDEIQKALDSVYGLGYFSVVDYSLKPNSKANDKRSYDLTVIARKSSKGNQTLRFGFGLSDDFDGDAAYQAGVQYIKKGITTTGAEFKGSLKIGETQTAKAGIYYPLHDERDLFLNPTLWRSESNATILDGTEEIAELRLREVGTQFDVGQALSNHDELRLGVFYRYATPKVKTGDSNILTVDVWKNAGLQLQYDQDTIDNINLPNTGKRIHASYIRGLSALGSDTDHTRLDLSYQQHWSLGKNHLMLGTEIATLIDDDGPILAKPRLGGLGRLSGLNDDELMGNHSALITGVYSRDLFSLNNLGALRAGASLEIGNVWDEQKDIKLSNTEISGSLFLGADTPLGLVYLGVGKTESYDLRSFLSLGQRF